MSRKRRGRSEGSIFERGDGIWTATISLGYTDKGKRKRKTVYGTSKQEVQEKLSNLLHSAQHGTMDDAGNMTVGAYLDHWLQVIKAKVRAGTYRRYEQHVRLQIKPHMGRVHLAKLKVCHVEQLLATLQEEGESDQARLKVGKVLRQALRKAVKQDMIPKNPASEVSLPMPAKKEIKPLDGDQAGRFLAAAKADRLYALYVLALDSGMRQGELFALEWSDIDFERGCVHVQRSLEELDGNLKLKEVKTAKGRRRIDLSSFTLDVLNEHRKCMLAEGMDVKAGTVFCDTEGKWLRKSNVQRRSFVPILARGNEKEEEEARQQDRMPALLPRIRFHDLRHTCATLLLLADINVKIVSERLGHAGIEITLNTYAHVLPTMQKKAAEKMDAFFNARVVNL